LQHRPSNASDHPFHDDHEEELALEGEQDESGAAAGKTGAVRRKGSSASLATLDLATVQEEDNDEVSFENAFEHARIAKVL
jgi:hypothetical protein